MKTKTINENDLPAIPAFLDQIPQKPRADPPVSREPPKKIAEEEIGADDSPSRSDGFSERRYLKAFPDIAEAVTRGEVRSGWDHYSEHGKHEKRLGSTAYLSVWGAKDSGEFPTGSVDVAFVSRDGWSFIVGWLNDEAKPLRAIAWMKNGAVISATSNIARCRRDDAAAVAGAPHGKLLGFWTAMRPHEEIIPDGSFQIRLWVGDDCKTFTVGVKQVENQELRSIILEYFAAAQYFTNYQVEAVNQLSDGLGSDLVLFNQIITERVIEGAHVMRFGQIKGVLKGSIIVCLFGKAEFLFIQSALFSLSPDMGDYELIFVSNSPELAETLVKEATTASRVYGVAITLVILPDNAGFGAANNIAASHALSKRIMIVNPDVFPRNNDWARLHTELITNLPADQTKIFGAPLFYDDGSLMHSGMYFDIDEGLSVREGRVHPHQIIRVEHYAKGAPPNTEIYLRSRKVPAVTGAFISLDRDWFEYLGGFSTEFVFGHYEDADLCLKSLESGQPTWVHNLPLWHLEGKGSTRKPVHEGGSTVNRWYFTTQWKDFIMDGLLGKEPAIA